MNWREIYKLYHQTFDETLFPKETMTGCREVPMMMVKHRQADLSQFEDEIGI